MRDDDLTQEELSIIERARPHELPDEATRSRVHQAVMVRIGAGVAVGTAGGLGAAAEAGAATTGTTKTAIAAKAAVAAKVAAAGTSASVAATGGAVAATATLPIKGALTGLLLIASAAAVGVGTQSSLWKDALSGDDLSDVDQRDVDQRDVSVQPAPPNPTAAMKNDSSADELAADKVRDVAAPSGEAHPRTPAGALNVDPGNDVPRPSTSSPTPPEDLASEAALIGRAQERVQAGDGQGALLLLDQHGSSYPSGALRQEANGVRVFALCAAGQVEQARAAADQFLLSAPSSPLAERVRNTCR